MLITDFIDKYDPCRDAKSFLFTQDSLISAWNTCDRSDWMLWAVQEYGLKGYDRELRLFSIAVVRHLPIGNGTLWDKLKDPRSRNAVEVAEKFLEGKATVEELKIARAADAAAAAYAAAYAAAAAAAAYAAAAAAADAERKKARQWMAIKLREFIPNPFLEK